MLQEILILLFWDFLERAQLWLKVWRLGRRKCGSGKIQGCYAGIC